MFCTMISNINDLFLFFYILYSAMMERVLLSFFSYDSKRVWFTKTH